MHYSNAKLGSDVNIDLDVSLRVHYGDQYRCHWQKAHVSGRRFQGDAAHSCSKRCKIILNKETLHFFSDNKTGSGLMLNIKWLLFLFLFFFSVPQKIDISHWEVSKTSKLKKKKKKKIFPFFCYMKHICYSVRFIWVFTRVSSAEVLIEISIKMSSAILKYH